MRIIRCHAFHILITFLLASIIAPIAFALFADKNIEDKISLSIAIFSTLIAILAIKIDFHQRKNQYTFESIDFEVNMRAQYNAKLDSLFKDKSIQDEIEKTLNSLDVSQRDMIQNGMISDFSDIRCNLKDTETCQRLNLIHQRVDADMREYLAHLETFASKVNSDTLDFDLVLRTNGSKICYVYYNLMPYIACLRYVFADNEYYKELQVLSERILAKDRCILDSWKKQAAAKHHIAKLFQSQQNYCRS